MKRVIVLLFVLLFIVGCGGGSPGEKAGEYNFKQGSQELRLSILENSPPDQVYPNSEVKLIVELDNQAAYPVQNGVLKLVGVNQQYFRMPITQQTFPLMEGRSLFAPQGDKAFLEFPIGVGQLFQNAQQYVNPYFLKLRYDSRVEFSDTLCIDPDLYDVYNGGCDGDKSKGYGGQGAPLGVTQLKQVVSPLEMGGRVDFHLQVRTVGKGKVGFVNLERAQLGGKDIECKFEGVPESQKHAVNFTEKRQDALLTCSAPLETQKSYQTTLQVSFTYDYEFKERRQLRLVNPLKSSGFF